MGVNEEVAVVRNALDAFAVGVPVIGVHEKADGGVLDTPNHCRSFVHRGKHVAFLPS